MRIRQKFLLILLLLAGIPLVGTFFFIAHLSRSFLVQQQGVLMERKAISMTDSLRFSVNEHIDHIHNWAESLAVHQAVTTVVNSTANRPFAGKSIEDIERQWLLLGEESQELEYFLSNEIAAAIKLLTVVNHAFVEVLVTDGAGHLLAASNKSSDYWQADESWWQQGASLPENTVWVEGVEFDKSAQVYSMDIVVPVFTEGASQQGAPLLGVIKGVVDVSPLVRSVSRILDQPGHDTVALSGDGKIIYRDHFSSGPGDVNSGSVHAGVSERFKGRNFGWYVSREKPFSDSFVGFSHLLLSGKTDEGVVVKGQETFTLLTTSGYDSAMAPVSYQLRVLVISGLIGLLLLLFTSDRIIQYFIIRPMNLLQDATEQITWLPASTAADEDYYGDTRQSIAAITNKISTKDEVRELAESFKKMSDRIIDNEIRLVGHQRELEAEIELRTQDLKLANDDLEANAVQLERLVEELESKNQDLESFAYIVSHDLKAPLRAIGSLADWLADSYSDKLDEEGQQIIGLMGQRVVRLDRLIDGVLEYSRAGAEQKAEVVSVQKIVDDVLASLDCPKHINIVINDPLPKLTANTTGITQVFQNLISNAIKFMDKSDGLIEISCRRQDAFWEFAIKDNGQGMERRHFDRIFKLFQKLHSKDEIEGTGIGLSVVQRRIKTEGGTIRVDSELGQGTVFVFTWPAIDKSA